MFKKLVVLLLFSLLTLSQHLNPRHGHFVGGYETLNPDASNSNEENEAISSIETFARSEFAKRNSEVKLGNLIKVERQLVAGFNYKMTFETESGNIQITVFDQSWTSTRKITSIETNDDITAQ